MHPDRNYGNVEETTRQFAEIQSAYEILSDPQERAWYDTHRDTILHDDDASGEHCEHHVRITTARDITRMFTRFHGTLDFSDSATGFYGVLRETFDSLAKEEEVACEWEGLDPVSYPSFGHADDKYESSVKSFYGSWNSFATKKTYSWEDTYRYSEAPDRRVRRMMEKENKRIREEAIREYNDAVRSLVAFVKKRDPRFKVSTQTEAERQKVLRDAANAQAARSRAANKAKHDPKPDVLPEWMVPSETPEEDAPEEADEAVKEQIECVMCKKNFKSEKQYEAHVKSKKHLRAAQHLRRQMLREDVDLNLSDPGERSAAEKERILVQGSSDSNELPASPAANDEAGANGTSDSPPAPVEDNANGSGEDDGQSQSGDPKGAPVSETSTSSSDDEYATREKVEGRILADMNPDTAAVSSNNDFQYDIDHVSNRLAAESLDKTDNPPAPPKRGKAKEKRARKAAEKSALDTGRETAFKCGGCESIFTSRTRLFNHIKDAGHAVPVSKPVKGGKGKK